MVTLMSTQKGVMPVGIMTENSIQPTEALGTLTVYAHVPLGYDINSRSTLTWVKSSAATFAAEDNNNHLRSEWPGGGLDSKARWG
jgi:hypothetical protein